MSPSRGGKGSERARPSVRAWVLGLVLASTAAGYAAGCTQAARTRAACGHCYCSPYGTRDATRPVDCRTIGYDVDCCLFIGS